MIGVLIYYYRALPQGNPLLRIAVGAVLGGAVGNIIDRLRLGHVTDWIHVTHYPTFNLADRCITVGMITLAIYLLFLDRAPDVMADRARHGPRPSPSVCPPSARVSRLDLFLVAQLPDFTRAYLQARIDAGDVRVDGRARKASFRLRGGERSPLRCIPFPSATALVPEPMPLAILYEDADVIVIDKPAGLSSIPARATGRERSSTASSRMPRRCARTTRCAPASSIASIRRPPAS